MNKPNCCEKCYDAHTIQTWPSPSTIPVCRNATCECHSVLANSPTPQPTVREKECVFCNTDKIKSPIQFHNDLVMSFEPLNPVVKGHRIFVSRKHVTDFSHDPNTFAEVCRLVSICSREGEYNVITSKGESATQSVFHLHVHLVPRTKGDNLMLPWTGDTLLSEIEKKTGEIIEDRMPHDTDVNYEEDNMYAGERNALLDVRTSILSLLRSYSSNQK